MWVVWQQVVLHFHDHFFHHCKSNASFIQSQRGNKEILIRDKRERGGEREERERETAERRKLWIAPFKILLTRITNQIIWRCCVENITIAIIIIIIIISITYVVSSNIDWNRLLIPNFLEYLEVICWLNIFCLILVWFNQKLDKGYILVTVVCCFWKHYLHMWYDIIENIKLLQVFCVYFRHRCDLL